ncbi:peptide deformylase [Nocardia seriolae]|nr:peptide deformylase [Nocardia seriolae]APA94385.1 Peptide deformylase [Nocardia seriolae]MTJ60403.1 peptide deformylase [Nocardia seriolae]MTJ75459.1 peptide deformylase [Nocardia seriolae]MTJ84706.1 peptide deformylase [Nocardia seriolae]MTK28694.1 peptide deformylase [Nocardia seriolae]
MAILPIRIVGDPVLHRATTPVTQTPEELAELIADMYETMDAAHGVGLAGNQVIIKDEDELAPRLFVYDCPDEAPRGKMVRRRGCVVNPVLVTSEIPETMPDPDDDEEGCLSVPGEQFPTGRADWAKVTGTDEKGEPVELEGNGFFARMLQHETGHLDGYLYVDVLVGRNARAAKKSIKRNGWGKPGLSWVPGTVPDPFGHDDVDEDDD